MLLLDQLQNQGLKYKFNRARTINTDLPECLFSSDIQMFCLYVL